MDLYESAIESPNETTVTGRAAWSTTLKNGWRWLRFAVERSAASRCGDKGRSKIVMRMLLRIDPVRGPNLDPRHVAGPFRACGLVRCQCVRVQPSVGFTVAVSKRQTASAVVINAWVIAPDDRIKHYQEITVVQGRGVFIQKHKRLGWRRPKDLRQLSKGEISLNCLVRVPTVAVHVPIQ